MRPVPRSPSRQPRIRKLATLMQQFAVLAPLMAAMASAHAAEKFTFLTDWYAQAEHGGYYQAQATGLYAKAGLDVTIKMGGPQVNLMQLLVAGQADCIMGFDNQTLKAWEQGIQAGGGLPSWGRWWRCWWARSARPRG